MIKQTRNSVRFNKLLQDIHKLKVKLLETSYWDDINKIELVVVSPLSRTLSTADLLFKNKEVPILALDELLEFPQSYQRCNLRDTIGNLVRIYPRINFDNIESNIDFNFIDSSNYKTSARIGFSNLSTPGIYGQQYGAQYA